MSLPELELPILSTSMTLSKDSKAQKGELESTYTRIATNVNAREIAIYELVENQTGQQWFIEGNISNKRFGYRICFTKPLAGVATTIAHGITDIAHCRITKMYGTLQDSPFTTAYPIPLGGVAPINLSIGAVNITVGDPTAAYGAYIAYVIVEYVRDR